MKKLFLGLLLGITVLFTTNSCITGAYAQDVVITETNGDVDVSLVIRYGTPYYFEGSLLYYLYDGWYYYPYLHNNYYYYYRYVRPLPPPRPGHRFVPRYDDRPHFRHHKDNRPFRSSTYSTQRPRGNNPSVNHRPNNNVIPRGGINRPSTPNRPNGTFSRPFTPNRGTINRPMTQPRNNGGGMNTGPRPQMRSGGAQHGGGHFGGRR